MTQYKINEIFEVVSGSTPSTSQENYWDGNIKWITPKDLSKLSSAVISKTERQITKDGLDSCSTHIIPKDSIIISSRAPIGYVAILGDEMCCNQGCKALVPTRKIDPYYFYYLLKTKNKQLNNLGTGSTFKELSKTKLEDFTVSVADIQTQNEVSSLLIKIDNARRLRRTSNALTDQFLQSIFLSMFGDPVRNVKGWKTETILCSGSKVQIGPFGTQLHVEDYVEGGIPLINPTHIQNSKIKEDNKFTITPKKFDELSNYHLTEGDIIMGRRGEMGRCALVTQREQGWLCGTGSLFIRPSKKLDSLYLLNVLTSKSFKETLEHEAKGVTMANLNKTIINNLLVPIPPIKLQQEFADIVAEAEQLRQRQRAHEMELEQLFKGLLQKYFG